MSAPDADSIAEFAPQDAGPSIIKVGRVNALAFEVMKIIPAAGMIAGALERGEVARGGHVVETSSGSFALGLALVAKKAGLTLTIVSDPAINGDLQLRLEELDVDLRIVHAGVDSPDVQTLRLEALKQALTERAAYWPRQYDNDDNPASYRPIGDLITEELGVIDVLVASVGSGGSATGLARALRAVNPELRVVGCDTFGSAIFGLPIAARALRGLGNSLVPKNVHHTAFDEVHWLDAPTAFHAARELQQKHALYYGPTSGAAWRVAEHIAAQSPRARVLTVFPDKGTRYAGTVFNAEWLHDNDFYRDAAPSGPVVVERLADVRPPWTSMNWGRRTLEDVLADQTGARS